MLAWMPAGLNCQRAISRDGPETASAMARRRLRSEFTEMPGLCLTVPQAQRLFGLSVDECEAALRHLTEQGVLRRTVQGMYVKA